MLIKSETYIFDTITKAAYTFGVLSHIGIGCVFVWMKVSEMVFFNFILSVPIFIICRITSQKGRHNLAFSLAFFELLFHQLSGVYFLGWGSGFQYFLIYLAGLTFFNARWSYSVRIFLISVIFASFMFLYMFFQVSGAYHLTNLQYNFLYLSNSLTTILGLTIFLNYYVQTSDKVEGALVSVNQELSEKNKQIQKTLTERNYAFECLDEELSEAANYVRTLLPNPIRDGSIRVDWRFIPSTSLGGDSFGYYWLDEDHFAIYLIDVSGHGVGAALLSVSVINTLRSQSLIHTDFKKPEMVLDALNKTFPGEKVNNMFFTIWYGVYNKNTRKLSYASGGHPPALLMDNSHRHNDTIKYLRTPNFIIGGDSNAIYKNSKQHIGIDSKLYIFSDGVYEIKKNNKKMWRLKDFTELMGSLKTEKSLNLDSIVMHVKKIGLSENFQDDFTIIEIVFD